MSFLTFSTALLKINTNIPRSTLTSLTNLKLKKIFLLNHIYFFKLCSLLGLNIHVLKIFNLSTILNYNSMFLKQFLLSLRAARGAFQTYTNTYWTYLQNNKFYKGLRYIKGLPVKGQRTHTNRKTARKLNGK